MILVTGGAGFIGSNFVLDWLRQGDEGVVNVDKLTYAGNLQNLSSIKNNARHIFFQGDIGNTELITRLLKQYQPRAIVNLAAESHVDRSIHGPEDFIQTNILGTFHLLEAVRAYWTQLDHAARVSVFCMYLPMKCMDHWRRMRLHSLKHMAINLTVPIRRVKLQVIIWFVPIIIRTGCPY